MLSWMYLNELEGFVQEEGAADRGFVPDFGRRENLPVSPVEDGVFLLTLPGKYGIVFPKVNNGFSASRAVRVRGENRESGATPERYRHCERGGSGMR